MRGVQVFVSVIVFLPSREVPAKDAYEVRMPPIMTASDFDNEDELQRLVEFGYQPVPNYRK
jgi:hypothetical protein